MTVSQLFSQGNNDRSAVKAARRGLNTAGVLGSRESEDDEQVVAHGTSQVVEQTIQALEPTLCGDEAMEGMRQWRGWILRYPYAPSL